VTMEVMQGLSYGQEITASWCGEGYYLLSVVRVVVLHFGRGVRGKGRSRHRPLIISLLLHQLCRATWRTTTEGSVVMQCARIVGTRCDSLKRDEPRLSRRTRK
jgi:hypothetical protein